MAYRRARLLLEAGVAQPVTPLQGKPLTFGGRSGFSPSGAKRLCGDDKTIECRGIARSFLVTGAAAHVTRGVDARRVIPVVCAVIEDGGGCVLVAQRPAHKHLGLKWEFAGGKVEPGEAPAAALVREIREELGCTITITQALPPFRHDYGDVLIEMMPFVCVLAPESPVPHPHEHIALRWVAPAELHSVDLAPADWPVVAAYAAAKR